MAALDELVDLVMPELPGASLQLVQLWCKQVAVDFVKRSRSRRKTTAALDVAANPGDIALPTSEVSATEQLVDLHKAWWDTDKLEVLCLDEIEDVFGPKWSTLSGSPKAVTQVASGALRLVPQPDTPYTAMLTLSITTAPNVTATTIDDNIFNRYREELAAGVKARLMAMPEKPWSNPQMAQAYGSMYMGAVTSAMVAATRGPRGAALLTKPHTF